LNQGVAKSVLHPLYKLLSAPIGMES